MKYTITDALFATEAFRVCPEDQPFWYTSGLFGPYYINTHFLFGSESEAKLLLRFIEKMAESQNRKYLCKELATLCKAQYEKSAIYRSVIDSAVEAVSEIDCDFISGGERRDYFFSIELARHLNKPHLALFKDNQAWYSKSVLEKSSRLDDKQEQKPDLGNALHVADLITEASSYTRNWINSVQAAGGKISDTLAIVDRCQGGVNLLEKLDINVQSLVQISPALFADALTKDLISNTQEKLLLDYYADPYQFVRSFLAGHPNFLVEQEKLDPKTAERVQRLREFDL
ncbi:MAG: orotate phosphoribosyltransferase [Clostridiaceae bacterium]|jgi:orotate phosphoribosyltransferase|nr:orotate phosphoribosyltransferase [Bacillota bacterium]NLN52079.1 orotate phosphoribosyltransferase [Clostridiaceae bacterium]